MTRPRLMLADDHASLVGALRALLEPHYDVVATVADGWSLLETAPKVNPDVIVLDIAMPLVNGFEAGMRLRQQMPDVKLIFLTMNDDPDLAAEAMRCGASAYLLKVSAGEKLLQTIETALKSNH
jgi:DNA-binding NarL/FixJ family response regulator